MPTQTNHRYKYIGIRMEKPQFDIVRTEAAKIGVPMGHYVGALLNAVASGRIKVHPVFAETVVIEKAAPPVKSTGQNEGGGV